MTIQLLLTSRFPIDVLLLVCVGLVAGFGWTVGAWLGGKLLK